MLLSRFGVGETQITFKKEKSSLALFPLESSSSGFFVFLPSFRGFSAFQAAFKVFLAFDDGFYEGLRLRGASAWAGGDASLLFLLPGQIRRYPSIGFFGSLHIF